LRYTKAGGGDQTEERRVGRAPQRGGKPSRGRDQLRDLLLAVDVRGHSLADGTEHRIVGNLGAWFELPQPAREGPQDLEPTRPRARIGAVASIAPGPLSHHLQRDRPTGFESVR